MGDKRRADAQKRRNRDPSSFGRPSGPRWSDREDYPAYGASKSETPQRGVSLSGRTVVVTYWYWLQPFRTI
jgi:hypothetical protein